MSQKLFLKKSLFFLQVSLLFLFPSFFPFYKPLTSSFHLCPWCHTRCDSLSFVLCLFSWFKLLDHIGLVIGHCVTTQNAACVPCAAPQERFIFCLLAPVSSLCPFLALLPVSGQSCSSSCGSTISLIWSDEGRERKGEGNTHPLNEQNEPVL